MLKKKLVLIAVLFIALLFGVLFIYNNTIGKIPRYIEKAIKDTYTKEEEFGDLALGHSELCDEIINNYKDTIENINLEKANIKDKKLNSTLKKYISGLEIRIKAYEAYKDELDEYGYLLRESDENIEPALITLVEDYHLGIEDTEYYKFITANK